MLLNQVGELHKLADDWHLQFTVGHAFVSDQAKQLDTKKRLPRRPILQLTGRFLTAQKDRAYRIVATKCKLCDPLWNVAIQRDHCQPENQNKGADKQTTDCLVLGTENNRKEHQAQHPSLIIRKSHRRHPAK